MNDDKERIQLSAVEDHDRILMPVRLAPWRRRPTEWTGIHY